VIQHTTFGETTLEIARDVIERFHYSGSVPTGQNRFFVWRVDVNGTSVPLTGDMFGSAIYAVADYGIGVNPYQAAFVSDLFKRTVTPTEIIELKRLARVEPRIEGLPLTYFLAKCHKVLRREGYRCVVSFSDPAHSHTGGIYRAANFKHCGKTSEEWHVVDTEGNLRHRRYAYRYARRNGVSIAEARQELGLERTPTPPKDRWVLWLS